MVVELSNSDAFVQIAPELGASLLSYSLRDGRHILRPRPEATDPFQTACYLLTPWCNRMDGGFALPSGEWRAIAPNHSAHPLPIHGSAAQQAWIVESKSSAHAVLFTICDSPAPFHYCARVQYRLTDAALEISLSVQHLGEGALPYGLGLHPWFARTKASRLQATATHWQRTDARLIPIACDPVETGSDIDFNMLRGLPTGLIDTAFSGWNGQATIQISDDLSVAIRTSPTLRHYQVYSTGEHADFVCFEPVTHPINAHNMHGYPGLQVLESGEQASITVNFSPNSGINHVASV